MAKEKKEEKPTIVVGDGTTIVVGDGTRRVVKKDNGILDTSAGEMILDVNAKDEEEKTIEGILNESLDGKRNDMTISFRINEEILKHIKQVAREISVGEKEDVNYQKLMVSVFLDKYPMKIKEKNDGK
jgi:hypothetical protein